MPNQFSSKRFGVRWCVCKECDNPCAQVQNIVCPTCMDELCPTCGRCMIHAAKRCPCAVDPLRYKERTGMRPGRKVW